MPTATKRPLPKVTENHAPVVVTTRRVHVMPSGDVMACVGPGPTATKRPLPKVTEYNVPPVAAAQVRAVQTAPSGDVMA